MRGWTKAKSAATAWRDGVVAQYRLQLEPFLRSGNHSPRLHRARRELVEQVRRRVWVIGADIIVLDSKAPPPAAKRASIRLVSKLTGLTPTRVYRALQELSDDA